MKCSHDELSDDDYPSDVMALIFDAIDIRKQIEVLGVTISTFLVFLDEKQQYKKRNCKGNAQNI